MRQGSEAATMQASTPQATQVVERIRQASHHTGISFGYLMAQAGKESDFKAEVGSRVTSATGLYQFTKGTWLQLMKRHGAALGLGDLADDIHRTAGGEYVVSDAATRQRILDLRHDPQISSMLAGEYARDNKAYLEKTLGRPVDNTDLYLAHFLGPSGAARILRAEAANPSQPAAPLLPQAAHNNPSVFYGPDRSARSVAAVYDRINHAIERPMRQYAKLDEPAAGEEAAMAPTGSGRHHGEHARDVQPFAVAMGTADRVAPFDQGGWPEAEPEVVASASAASMPAATDAPPLPADGIVPASFITDAPASPSVGDLPRQADYTDSDASADRISIALASPGMPAGGDGKGLFGRIFESVKRSLLSPT